MSAEPIRAVDLFCGAGGLSWGLVEALREVAVDADEPTDQILENSIDLVGINHWEQAIETHEANHPWARHWHDDVQNVNPREVFDECNPDVTVLSGGIECTHWSTARGGKPVSEQKRMPAWDFLNWVQKLRPANVLVENVPEFEDWGPIADDGTPTRNGETFDSWVDSLHSLGYAVEWQTLDAADYGDATSRERLFVLATREGSPTFPAPTHSDVDSELPDRRPAAEIIDWSEPGGSIWTRDLEDPRKRPLKNSTMQRIAEGVRRHCDDRLGPFADALDEIGRDEVRRLRQDPVPAEHAATAARVLDGPFLVSYGCGTALGLPREPYLLRQQSGGVPPSVAAPLPTISGTGSIAKVESRPLIMPRNGPHRGLHSNPLYDPADRPLHTVTAKNTDGYLVSPSLVRYLCPLYNGRARQRPRTRALDRPLMTVPASKSPAGLASPYLVSYHGNDGAEPVSWPLPTVTARDRFALVVPELYPWGLDVRYRMLQPRELKRAQGFPPDYEIRGNKRDTTRQIGNAVPVNLAQRLVESLLVETRPALTDFVDADPADESAADDPTVVADGGERS